MKQPLRYTSTQIKCKQLYSWQSRSLRQSPPLRVETTSSVHEPMYFSPREYWVIAEEHCVVQHTVGGPQATSYGRVTLPGPALRLGVNEDKYPWLLSHASPDSLLLSLRLIGPLACPDITLSLIVDQVSLRILDFVLIKNNSTSLTARDRRGAGVSYIYDNGADFKTMNRANCWGVYRSPGHFSWTESTYPKRPLRALGQYP